MAETNDHEAALREARFVLRLQPDHAEARVRVDSLALKVATLQDAAEKARRDAAATSEDSNSPADEPATQENPR